jgi:phage tail-like protein
MLQPFPITKYHFGVFFLFPQFNFNAGFQSVSGLGMKTGGKGSIREGGNNGMALPLTESASFTGTLTLKRGLTQDRALYEWCEGTLTTMKTQPCNILVSALDKRSMPVKNWLIFNAFPTGWDAGGLDVSSTSDVMVENVTLAYQSFILI